MKYLIFTIGLCLSFSINSQTDSISDGGLLLREVVVTDMSDIQLVRSALSLSVIPRPADQSLQGVADILSRVPGMFVDASVGEAYTRVHTRGVSLSAEDDIGWFYTSLQEDGLPISLAQFQYFTPDFFIRPDLSYGNIEVLRGGKSSILAANGPGGIVNFISNKRLNAQPLHIRATGGIHASGRPYGRLEGYVSDKIEDMGLALDFSFLYRYDRGPREVDFPMNRGGQFKFGVSKLLKNGVLSFSIKRLDDRINRYTGVPAQNWNNPEPAFGFSFQNSTLLPPTNNSPFNQQADGLYSPSNGIHTAELAGRIDLDLNLGEWRLLNKMKYSSKSIDWRTAIGGQPSGLDNFITYFVSGDAFPAGLIKFGDRAVVNNEGAFAVFQGLPPSFEYISGSLPNDAIMATGFWQKDDNVKDFMNELKLSRSFENMDMTGGLFLGRGTVDINTRASFLYSTYEENPEYLEVSIINPGEPVRQLSAGPLSNIDGLFYEGADIDVNHFSLFGDFRLNLLENLDANIGARWENISHKGTKDRFAPTSADGGADGNPLTSYDNGSLQKAGDDPIDFKYGYLSYSAALNYNLSDQASLFIRHSLGHKAPELNYYINNFSNVEVNEAGKVQDILQTEIGGKWGSKDYDFSITGFRSKLKNVAFSNFVFDNQTNQIFYTPTQFNESSTLGVEIESRLKLTKTIDWNTSITGQRAKLDKYTLYDANGTADTSDDIVQDASDGDVPHSPNMMFRTGLSYSKDTWYAGVNYQYMGKRFGNIQNSFTLPAYGIFNADLSYGLSSKVSLGLRVRNVLNTAGLANFFGPNEFGSSAAQATTEYINNNPNGSFVVFPVNPRAVYISVDYNF